MASTQTDRLGSQVPAVPVPPVRVYTGATGATCQIGTTDASGIVEINAGNQAITCVLPASGGPYTIVDGADVATTYPVTIQNASLATVGVIAVNGGAAMFSWDGARMVPIPIIAGTATTGVSVAMQPVLGAATTVAATSLLHYLAPGASATARSVTAKLTDTISARDYGVVADGVTDDTAAVNAAIAAVPANGGYLLFPSGKILVSSTINIGNGTSSAVSTINNVFLVGSGNNSPFQAADIGTTFLWGGAVGGTVIEFQGAMSGGGMLGGWAIDGAGKAANGLIVNHLVGGQFPSLKVQRCTGVYLWLTTKTVPDTVGGVRNNRFGLYETDTVPSGGVGLLLTALTTTTGDCLQNTFDVVDILISGSGATGIQLGYADFNNFNIVDISAQTTLSTSVGIAFIGSGPSGDAFFPSLNRFGLVASTAPVQTDTTNGQPYGNYIEVWDFADSNNVVPTATGVYGYSLTIAPSSNQKQTIPFGFKAPGYNVTTPSIPALNTAVQNTNTYPVIIYMAPASGTGISGITLTDQHGSPNSLPNAMTQIRLDPTASVTFTSVVPGSWIWYGLSA